MKNPPAPIALVRRLNYAIDARAPVAYICSVSGSAFFGPSDHGNRRDPDLHSSGSDCDGRWRVPEASGGVGEESDAWKWCGSGRAPKAAVGNWGRGGVRVIYYWAEAHDVILMLYLFPKNEQDNLTAAQKRALHALVKKEYP
jgi:hypothetical protein